MPTSVAVLEIEDIEVAYGGVTAVSDVSLRVEQGEVLALLGANGAGKSSLLRAVSGLIRPSGGTMRLREETLDRLSARARTRLGVVHVPEGRRVVAPLTVEENLQLAARASHRRRGSDIGDGLDEVYGLFPRLHERRGQISGLLSGGEQQMLAIGRGIMARPEILLLDEPSMGLAPIVIEEIYDFLKKPAGTLDGTAILLAEQSAALAVSVATRAHVLARGRTTYSGLANELDAEAAVDAYFGLKGDASGDATTLG